MTLPIERTQAVLRTEMFLIKLCIPKETPGVPKEIRQEAGMLLEHYPSEYNFRYLVESCKWKSYNLMYFEHLIQTTPDVVAHILQIEYDVWKCEWEQQKNPRKIQDIILNYKELYNVLSEVTLI